MGLLDIFKKKEPELDIDSSLGLDANTGMGSDLGHDFSNPMGQQGMPGSMGGNDYGLHEQFQPSVNLSTQQFQPVQSGGGGDLQKDIQILSLKLDAIKAELDGINQRIKNIEHIAEKEQQAQQPKKWY